MESSRFSPLPLDFITRCERILNFIQGRNLQPETTETITQRLRDSLDRLKSEMADPPKLTVAVYGDTGAGKSSLLNAILDEPSLVPTQGLGNACTPVVMKIEENKTGQDFEAEIVFFSKEEWEKVMNVLTMDLMDGCTDYEDGSTPYEAAQAMVSAVYGQYEDNQLEHIVQTNEDVNAKLGTKPVHSFGNARELQDKLWEFIDERDDGNGGQYWPLVKEITLKIPRSELCKNGTVLIDLPGVGDSNPARDNVAKKYIQDSDVLMIVANIKRAVDNKTAKSVLGERMFQQVQLDQRQTVLVCTQTDDIKPHEVIRKYKLPQANKWTEESQRLNQEEKDINAELELLKGIAEKSAEQHKAENGLYQKNEIVRGKREQLKKEKLSTCAVERNKIVKRDMLSAGGSKERMEVFCVSSTDYHKLAGGLSCDDDDDRPPVFMKIEETEIQDLQNFLKQSSEKKTDRKRNFIINEFRVLVSGVLTYLISLELGGQKKLKSALQKNLQILEKEVERVIDKAENYIKTLFLDRMLPVLEEAVSNSENYANRACKNWARPVNKHRRQLGGLAFGTYRATVTREGEYTSKGIGFRINMNADLTDQFLQTISETWEEIFSEDTWTKMITEQIREPFSRIMEVHANKIHGALKSLGLNAPGLSANIDQLRTDAIEKMQGLEKTWPVVQKKSREITHGIPEILKKELKPTYDMCKDKTGAGAFQDMKLTMEVKVDHLKTTMFKNIKDQVLKSLDAIREEVILQTKEVLQKIYEDHKKQVEPMWQNHGGANFFENLRSCTEEVLKLKEDLDTFEKQEKGTKRQLEEEVKAACKLVKTS